MPRIGLKITFYVFVLKDSVNAEPSYCEGRVFLNGEPFYGEFMIFIAIKQAWMTWMINYILTITVFKILFSCNYKVM